MALDFENPDDIALFEDIDATLFLEDAILSLLDPSFALLDDDIANKSDGDSRSATRRARDAQKRRISRQREKIAREKLRQQSRELAQELDRLKKAKQAEKEAAVTNRSATYFLWRAFAIRQRQQRFKAEQEQKQLTTMVNTQASYIQSLTGAVRKRLQDGQESIKKLKLSSEDQLCDAYMSELEEMYRQFDALLRESRTDEAAKIDSSGEVEYYQKVTKFVQPMSLYQTSRMLWKVGKATYLDRSELEHYDVQDPENSIALRFRDEAELKTGTKVSVRQRIFARRFPEENRTVHVWKFISEGEGAFSGIQSVETGWCVLRPSGEAETSVEMYQRWTPMQFKDPHLNDTSMKDFNELVNDISDTTLNEVMSAVERLGLDDSREIYE